MYHAIIVHWKRHLPVTIGIIRDGQWQKNKVWQESSNGTYVNSAQVTQQGYRLKVGDIISIGDVKMRFENY